MDVVAERFGGRGGDGPEEKRVPYWVAAFHLTPPEFKRLFFEMQVRPRTRGARTGTGGAGVQSRGVGVTAHREAPYQSGRFVVGRFVAGMLGARSTPKRRRVWQQKGISSASLRYWRSA